MYCVHARKIASEAPRTHFRACKISKFPGSVSPTPPSHNPFCGVPIFVFGSTNPLGGPEQGLMDKAPVTSPKLMGSISHQSIPGFVGSFNLYVFDTYTNVLGVLWSVISAKIDTHIFE